MDINIEVIESIFPYHNNLEQIQIDEEGLYSISSKNVSRFISNIIKKYIRSNSYNDITITDATAGVGGNTISFLQNYGNVNSIEIDSDRFSYLKNNIEIYNLSKKIKLYNADYTLIYDKLEQDIVFIDPPWGGKNYKDNDNIDLKLSDIDLSLICNNLKDNTNLIVIKVPQNFNFKNFYNNILYKFVHIHKLNKMDIIVIENYGNH